MEIGCARKPVVLHAGRPAAERRQNGYGHAKQPNHFQDTSGNQTSAHSTASHFESGRQYCQYVVQHEQLYGHSECLISACTDPPSLALFQL